MLEQFFNKATYRRAKRSLLDMHGRANPEAREYLRSVLHDLYFALDVAEQAAPEEKPAALAGPESRATDK